MSGAAEPPQAEAVALNVGGIVHTTTRATLCKFPGSMLAAMFGGSFTPSVLRDPAGHAFIDRDGRLFRHVLNYLRCSRLCLPEGFAELELLEAEADFFGLPGLLLACRERREAAQAAAAAAGGSGARERGLSAGPGCQQFRYLVEVLEFEETAYFYRFYMPPPNRQSNNGAFKSGGLVVSGHAEALRSLPLPRGAAEEAATAAAAAAAPDSYQSVSVSNAEKMALFHHMSRAGWALRSDAFSYSTDSDGSYIVHKYIWLWPADPSASPGDPQPLASAPAGQLGDFATLRLT